MKICFVSPKSYPVFNPKIRSMIGGAEVQIYFLATEIAKDKKYEVHCLVSNYEQNENEIIKNVKLWKGVDFDKNNLYNTFKLFKVFRKVNADIYVKRSLSVYSVLVLILCKLFKKKYVYMVSSDKEFDGTNKMYKSIFGRLLAYLNFKCANVVITQNSYQLHKLKKIRKDAKLLKSSYPVVNHSRKESKHILWVGRGISVKRPHLFLKLARKLPKYKFLMICPTSTDEPQISKIMEEKSLSIKNLQFIEKVPFSDIDKYFQKAIMFVNTSDIEGFPNTFLQAALNKVPVISLKVNPNNYLTKYGCGLVCNGNTNKLEKNVLRLVNDNKLSIQMGKNAYKYAKTNHNIKINVRQFEQIITNA